MTFNSTGWQKLPWLLGLLVSWSGCCELGGGTRRNEEGLSESQLKELMQLKEIDAVVGKCKLWQLWKVSPCESGTQGIQKIEWGWCSWVFWDGEQGSAWPLVHARIGDFWGLASSKFSKHSCVCKVSERKRSSKQTIPAFPELNNRSLDNFSSAKRQNSFQLLGGWAEWGINLILKADAFLCLHFDPLLSDPI